MVQPGGFQHLDVGRGGAMTIGQSVWQVTGIKEVDAQLKKFPGTVQKKLTRKAMRKAAKHVVTAAKAMAPKDSGRLGQSIKVRGLKRSRKTAHIVGVRIVTGKDLFKGEYYYGGFVEYGTRYQPARSFLRRAAHQQEDVVLGVFRGVMKEIVAEESYRQTYLA